jgi:hypothetical protein
VEKEYERTVIEDDRSSHLVISLTRLPTLTIPIDAAAMASGPGENQRIHF